MPSRRAGGTQLLLRRQFAKQFLLNCGACLQLTLEPLEQLLAGISCAFARVCKVAREFAQCLVVFEQERDRIFGRFA
jgi:hypothetical protein